MRTCLGLPSSMIDMRARRLRVRGPARLHPAQEAVVDLVDDLQVARQQRSNSGTGHFSSASGSSVWLV